MISTGRMSQLGATEQQLRAMFSQAAVGIALVDLAGRFVEANDQACALYGYTLEELLGKTFLDLTHPDDVARTRECVEKLEAGEIESYVLEKRYLRKDGTVIWCTTTVTALRGARGEVERFMGFVQDITRRIQGEEVRSRLAALVRSTDDAIITKTLDGVITSWNPAAERMFGYAAEEAIGQPVTILFPADLLDEEVEILARLKRNESIHHYHTLRRRKDGTLLNVSLSVSSLLDANGHVIGASKIARDITGQKRDEAALREHSQVLELLVTTGQSIAAGLELQGILQRVTDLGRQISGAEFGAFFYNVTDERGESYLLYTLSGAPRSAFEKFGLPRNTAVFAATFSGKGVVRSGDIKRDPRYGQLAPHFGMPSGHLPVCSYLAVPVIARSGQVLGGLFFGHSHPDVFDERAEKLITGVAVQAAVAMDNARLYEEAQREIASRVAAENRLRDADRRKDEFLAMLAHELRNPLAPIRQAAALAAAPGSSEQQTRWGLEVIDRQVRHMSALLNDLLDIARITRGALDLRPAATSVGEIVDSALETARPVIANRRHTLHVDVSEREAALLGDPLRLAQILENLLLNASKYTDPHGVITLRAVASPGEIEFSVRDSGIGISPEAMTELFTMFTQVSSHRERSEGGLGIGLALAKGLAELHGGTIEARSDGPGHGSEFIVRIPRKVPEQVGSTEVDGAAARRGVSRKVLIADDNEDAAITLATLLQIWGHHVTVVHDGEQALQKFDEQQPEFVLLDIGMPKLDGHEVARRIRQRAGDKPNLIALTGWGQESDKAKARAAGFDRHFTKPIDPDQLLDLLASRQ